MSPKRTRRTGRGAELLQPKRARAYDGVLV